MYHGTADFLTDSAQLTPSLLGWGVLVEDTPTQR